MSQKFLSEVTLQALNNATTDTDRFLVSDSGTVKYRTGTQLLSDIGGQAALTNPITGTGTLNYVSKFTGTSTLGDSQIFDNSSGVGIGTTNPTFAKLKVSGASASGAIISEDISGTTSFVRILGDISSQNLINWQSGTALRFATSTQDYASFSEAMRITSAGNVGIGTTSPGAKLHVAGEGIFDDNTYGRLTLGFASSQNDIYSTTTGFGAWKNFKLNANELIFSSGGTTERMRISSAGNVGIGTTSPATKLEVSGIASFTGSGGRSVVIEGQGAGRIDINGDGSAYAVGIKFNSSPGGTALSGIWNYGSGTSQQWLAIGGTAYNNAALYTLPSGDVGIGTSSPAAILDVNGDALINQLTIGQGPATGQQNTAIGRGALGSMSLASANIALGHLSNADNDSTGLTTIGVELNTNTNLDPLLQDCLAISQYNSNAYSNQVPHIYAPKPINVPANAFTNVISFDIDHYAGAIIEYIIRLNDGGDYAVGTVYTGWKTSGDGTLIDDRQTQFNNMSGFVFSLGFNNTIKLQNTTSNAAWIRITVRGMMTN